MLFFDYDKLYIATYGSSADMVKLLPKSKGDNFIVNENVVLNNPYKLSSRELAEYLGICSLRSYADYCHGIKYLEVYKVPPWIPIPIIQSNPLVEIKNEKIYFKYED